MAAHSRSTAARRARSRSTASTTGPPCSSFAAGTLDDPSTIEPDVHIFTKSKLPWVAIPDSAPAFDVFYDINAVWPAASLERVEALRARNNRAESER